MGIRFRCPNGHRLNVKSFLAGKRGVCPYCKAKFQIPTESLEKELVSAATETAGHEGGDSKANGLSSDSPKSIKLEFNAETASQNDIPAPVAAPSPPSDAGHTETGHTETGQNDAGPSNAGLAETGPPDEFNDADQVAESQLQSSNGDPINEAPHAVWYVRPPTGGQYGPASGDIMRTWITEGRVSGDSLIWRQGWAEWQNAADAFPVLSDHLPIASDTSAVQVSAPQIVTAPTTTALTKRGKRSQNTVVILLGAALLDSVDRAHFRYPTQLTPDSLVGRPPIGSPASSVDW